MKGKNTVKLNAETMLEAVQMWADSSFTSKPRVTGVRQIAEQAVYQGTPVPMHYEVDVEGPDDPQEPKT